MTVSSGSTATSLRAPHTDRKPGQTPGARLLLLGSFLWKRPSGQIRRHLLSSKARDGRAIDMKRQPTGRIGKHSPRDTRRTTCLSTDIRPHLRLPPKHCCSLPPRTRSVSATPTVYQTRMWDFKRNSCWSQALFWGGFAARPPGEKEERARTYAGGAGP